MLVKIRFPWLLIILVGLLVYGQSLFNGFVIGDDEDQILHNPLVQSLSHSFELLSGSTYYQEANQNSFGLFYRPIMLFVYSLIYNVFGTDPLPFHLLQLCLHIVNAILIYYLFNKFWPRHSSSSLFLSILFLVHPLNSETVLHIANLQETLCLGFGLSSFLLFTTKKHLLGGGLLLLAFLSKETGLVFGLYILVWCWLFSRKNFSKVLMSVGILSAGYVFMRWQIIGISTFIPSVSRLGSLTISERFLYVPTIFSRYLVKFFWPQPLAIYQFWIIKETNVMKLLIFPTAVIAWFILTYRILIRKSISDSQKKRIWLWSSWLVIGLSFYLHLLPLYLTFAERWIYIAMIGLLGLIGEGYLIIGKQYTDLMFNKKQLIVTSGWLLVISMGIVSYRRSGDWHDSYSLLTADIDKLPQDYYVENLLATLLIRDKKFAEAEPYLLSSVSEHSYVGNLSNLAIVRLNEKKYPEAELLFTQALADEDTYLAVVNYVNYLMFIKKDYLETRIMTDKYLLKYPYGFELWLNLAQSLYLQNEYEKALAAAEKAVELEEIPISRKVYEQIKAKQPLNIEGYWQL